MAKEIEMTVQNEKGEQTLIKAVAVIAIVRTDKGLILDVRENGDLTEEWWAALPAAMQVTIDEMVKERRKSFTAVKK